MNDIIVIGFNNDTRTYELPKDITKFYPNSILSLYETAETNEKIIIEDMTFENFQIVYDVIIGKQKQWLVASDILKFLDKYGLVDDILLKLHNNINIKSNNELSCIDEFVNGNKEQLLLTSSAEYYDEYKKLFENNKNIMSVQITYDFDKLTCINILEKVPIYYKSKNVLDNIYFEDNIDINLMRYNIIVKNLGCQKCNICHECNPLKVVNLTCKKCCYCNNCKNYYRNIYYKNKETIHHRLIYDNNNMTYLKALTGLMYDDGCSLFQKVKSNDVNIINWHNIANEKFNHDINYSINKIIDVVFGNDLNIKQYYKTYHEKSFKQVQEREDVDHDIVTYFGFLNISNILK